MVNFIEKTIRESDILKKENQQLKNKINELEKEIDANNFLTYSAAKACSNSKADFLAGKIRMMEKTHIDKKELKNLINKEFGIKAKGTLCRYIRMLVNMNVIQKDGKLFRIMK